MENLNKKIVQNSKKKLNFYGAKIKFDHGIVAPLKDYNEELNYKSRVEMLNEDHYDFLKIFKKKIYKKFCYWPQNKRFADGLMGLNWHKKNSIKK